MKVTLQRKPFLECLELAASVASNRAKDLYGKVRFVAHTAQLEATDGETSITVDCGNAVESRSAGIVLLDPKRTVAIFKESRGDSITLDAQKKGLVLLTSEGQYTLPAEDPEVFPDIDSIDGDDVMVHAQDLLTALSLTTFAVDSNATRFQLNGVLVDISPDEVNVVATDGRRLSSVVVPLSEETPNPEASASIVPCKPLALVAKTLTGSSDPCKIRATKNAISFQVGGITIKSQLIDGKYPVWRSVIPNQDNCERIELNAGDFSQAVKQAAIVTSPDSNGVVFYFAQDNCGIAARTAEIGESEVNLPITFTGSLKLTVDHRFVADWVGRLPKDEKIEMVIKNPKSPVVFTWGLATYVIMPMEKS